MLPIGLFAAELKEESKSLITPQRYEELARQVEAGMAKPLESFRNFNQIFTGLDIQLGEEEDTEFLHSHKVIINRRPRHKKLVVACGNLPAYKAGIKVHYIDNYGSAAPVYRAQHAHADADTIDPDFARNPSIVGAVTSLDLREVFGAHRYELIEVEGIILSELAKHTLLELLAEQGTLVFIEKSQFKRTFKKIGNTYKIVNTEDKYCENFAEFKKQFHWFFATNKISAQSIAQEIEHKLCFAEALEKIEWQEIESCLSDETKALIYCLPKDLVDKTPQGIVGYEGLCENLLK